MNPRVYTEEPKTFTPHNPTLACGHCGREYASRAGAIFGGKHEEHLLTTPPKTCLVCGGPLAPKS